MTRQQNKHLYILNCWDWDWWWVAVLENEWELTACPEGAVQPVKQKPKKWSCTPTIAFPWHSHAKCAAIRRHWSLPGRHLTPALLCTLFSCVASILPSSSVAYLVLGGASSASWLWAWTQDPRSGRAEEALKSRPLYLDSFYFSTVLNTFWCTL